MRILANRKTDCLQGLQSFSDSKENTSLVAITNKMGQDYLAPKIDDGESIGDDLLGLPTSKDSIDTQLIPK